MFNGQKSSNGQKSLGSMAYARGNWLPWLNPNDPFLWQQHNRIPFRQRIAMPRFILPNAIEPSESEDTQVFVGLLDEPMNRRFFYYNREFMHKSYMHVMETVCDKIFGETSAIEVDESGMRPVIRPIGEGASSHGAALGIFRTHNEPGEVLAHASDEVPKATKFKSWCRWVLSWTDPRGN